MSTKDERKLFAMTGVAGYIAPRHLEAIKSVGGELAAAVDPHDSVGILDRYFPDAAFFTEFERFDRHLEKLRRGPEEGHVRWVSICSPNHLHDAHIRLALRIGADAICEKPLVLNPWNLDALERLEAETGRRVWTVLQLRLHPALLDLKRDLEGAPKGRKHVVSLRYITPRGTWYRYSWKGSEERSGGVVTNIGIHLFDALLWLFGPPDDVVLAHYSPTKAEGTLSLRDADVSWVLSIERNDLPPGTAASGAHPSRSMTVDGKEIDFTEGFTGLHTRLYEETLAGRGFGIDDARPSIELAYRLRVMGSGNAGRRT
ncbi:MAG: Gfo/Idh/MocA family oxidoreductase [Bacteroidota bacterium]|nr:Gfo/Idh/MocA family oxidoreductase [Bacteroidota bacterium]